MSVVLASQSPQRSAILAQLGLPFRVLLPIVDEVMHGDPTEVVLANARRKAAAVSLAARPDEVVIACDTVVVKDGEIYGKPRDEREARAMLASLQGRAHEVVSGVHWQTPSAQGTFAAQTTVTFRELTEHELDRYLATGEWRGRAGGYAIQGAGSGLVARIEGCFWNVVGLPGPQLLDELRAGGVDVVAFAPAPRPFPELDDPRAILRAALRDAVTAVGKASPDVLGVWEGGSAAFSRADADSDLDLQMLVVDDVDVEALFGEVEAELERVEPIAQSWRAATYPRDDTDQKFFRTAVDDLLLVDLSLVRRSASDWFLQPERHGAALLLHDPQGLLGSAPSLDRRAHEQRLVREVADAASKAELFGPFVGKELRRGRTIDARFMYDRLVIDPLILVLGAVHRPDTFDFGRRYLREALPTDIYRRLERLFHAPVAELPEHTREAVAWCQQLAEQVLSDRGVTTDPEVAGGAIRAGQLVGLPTETVYGLGADASSAEAVRAIFMAKDRPTSSPLIIHVADASDVATWAMDVPAVARRLADAFWPGPLTLVLRAGEKVAPEVTAGGNTVGIRVPDHPLARAAIRFAGTAVAAPSANRHGEVSPVTATDVRATFGADIVPVVLDGGQSRVGLESTIVDVTGPRPTVLRLGGVGLEALSEVLGGELDIAVEHLELDELGGVPTPVPGQARVHYSPTANVEIVRDLNQLGARVRELASTPGITIGVAVSCEADQLPAEVRAEVQVLLAASKDAGYASGLYGALRTADSVGVSHVLALPPSEGPLVPAILDRLVRASAG